MKKKILGLLLCAAMLLSLMPMAALAVAPSLPANVQVDESNQKVTWEAVSEATEYLVGLYQVDAAASNGWITMGYIRVPTAYVEWSDFDDTFWLGGKEYFIGVQACNASDERSAPVYSEHFTCSKEVLEITNIHWGTTESDRYVLYWDEVPTATKYTVSIKGPSGSGGGTVTTNQYDARSFVISKGNGDYTATVYAYRGQTGSILIDKKTTTAHSITIPTLATPVVAVDLSSYEITWDTIEHASSYTVELHSYFETIGYGNGYNWFKGEKYGITGTSCSLSEFSSYLENGKNYFVRVFAKDSTGSYATSMGRSDYFTYSHTHNLADDNVWVNGEQFTSNKLTIPCGTGTATYDPATNTVTLDGAQITSANNKGAIYAGDQADRTLTVNVIGDSSIHLDSDTNTIGGIYADTLVLNASKNLDICVDNKDSSGIYTTGRDVRFPDSGDVTISGSGNVTINSGDNGIYSTGSVTISGSGDVTVAARSNGFYCYKTVTISGSGNVNITSKYSYGIFEYGDVTISASGDVKIRGFYSGVYIGKVGESGRNLILSGSGKVDIGGTQRGVTLCGDGKVFLNGTGSLIKLHAGSTCLAVYNGDTKDSPVTGSSLDKYEVIGDPASESVVYARKTNVWVNGEQFTAEKSTIACGSGTATYDPDTNTVTLNNAQITNACNTGAIRANGALTVNVVGDSSITLDSSIHAHGIFADRNLTLTGSGNLDIRVESDYDGLETIVGNIVIAGSGDVTVNAGAYGVYTGEEGYLNITGSGDVDIYGEWNGAYGGAFQLVLNGTGGSVKLSGGYRAYNDEDGDSIAAGNKLGDYTVTGDPASDSVTYTYKDSTGSLIGDVNGDGSVDSKDVLLLKRAAAGLVTLKSEQKANADVNHDGSIDSKDVLMLKRAAAGLITLK